jgi:hypothetical protein
VDNIDLASLDKLLYQTPVVVHGLHPVSLAYLPEGVKIYEAICDLAWALDEPKYIQPHRAITFDNTVDYAARFPIVSIKHDPFTTQLNRVLLDKYDFINAHMLTQAQVANQIVSDATRFKSIVLVLLDGLSYSDCKEWPGTVPCLTAHPTITRVGFPAVVGNPPLATRLFKSGLTRRIGFTYWERNDNLLADRLFQTITETIALDPTRPNAFKQITDWMSINNLSDTFIQIARSALDDYAEGHRTTIPRKAVLHQIRGDLEAVLDILEHKGQPAILFAVADHGILWKEDEHQIERIKFSGGRYMQSRAGQGRGRYFEADGTPYWVLDYPQMGRQWLKNEQGIHGGMSFEESIVPFIRWEVNSSC